LRIILIWGKNIFNIKDLTVVSILKYLCLVTFLYSSCPQIIDSQLFYEDECGDCWLPYCYDFNNHIVSYDVGESECSSNGMTWVIPGDDGDSFFNNYCDSCPEGFYEDDCGDCWMAYCYDFSVHIPYYDTDQTECTNSGMVWVIPGGNAGDPYWNSSCDEVECPEGEVADCQGVCDGSSMLDDCDLCQSEYCYDYVTHEVSFSDCDGTTQMWVYPNDYMNPYWNATCTDCNGFVNGNSMVDDCGECQSAYCYDYATHEVSFGDCNGATQIEVLPNNESNLYWNSTCTDCSDTLNGDSMVDDCGECQSAYCYDDVTHEVSFGDCDGATQMWVSPNDPMNPYWNACQDCALLGDLNSDGSANVVDVISMVDSILNYTTADIIVCGDMNYDDIVNITDVVALVNEILGNSRILDATSASIIKTIDSVKLSTDGFIGAIEMTLIHSPEFSIELTDDAMVSDYKTTGNLTRLIVVVPRGEELFTVNGDFEIIEFIVVNSIKDIDASISTPVMFSLSSAYPNPFNPTTSVELKLSKESYVSIEVYNLMGQSVATIAQGYMTANVYSFSWNASDVPSGIYFIRAEAGSNVEMQKVMLLK